MNIEGSQVSVPSSKPALAPAPTLAHPRARPLLSAAPLAALAFLSPALVTLGAVLAVPIGYSLALSFFDTTATTLVAGSDAFLGAENYVKLFSDASFRNALWLGALFTVVTTALEVCIATAVALYLDRILRVPRVVEVLLIVPMFVIPVVSGLTFRYLLDPGEGVLGHIYGLFGREAPGVLDHPSLAFAAIVAQDVWRMWPFVFLIVYAGLKTLPHGPLEAARLDGASFFQCARYVILPMLKPTLVVAVLLKVVESLKAFTEIYVMTGGGPGEATSLFSMFIVKQAFTHFQLGYASAASALLFFLGALVAAALGVARGMRTETKEGAAR